MTKAPLNPIFTKPGALPFETVAMDFIIKLPLSNGYDSILTVTDHDCTKAVILIPCNEAITAEGVTCHETTTRGVTRRESVVLGVEPGTVL